MQHKGLDKQYIWTRMNIKDIHIINKGESKWSKAFIALQWT